MRSSILILVTAVTGMALPSRAALADRPAAQGANIALGAGYSLAPAPDYAHCTDPRDDVQLTDGELTEGYFWTQQGTVGWRYARHVSIVVDLGEAQPIQGVSFRTAAGKAGVYWPAVIRIHVSDNRTDYRDVGDLTELAEGDRPPTNEYAVHVYATSRLETRGRYVRFLVLPAGPYVFTDEIEIFRGPDSLLEKDPGGEPVGDLDAFYVRYRVEAGIRRRFDLDLQNMKALIGSAGLGKADEDRLLEQWRAVETALRPTPHIEAPLSFQAVLPFDHNHARLFGLQAQLWRLQGHTGLQACPAGQWDPIDPFAKVEARDGVLEVHTMLGEYRSAAFNLTSSLDDPVEIEISFAGLDGAPTPDFISVHEVVWTDTASGHPVAAALPEARRIGSAWRINVLPGLPRQVWLTFHVTDLPPGEHAGDVVMESAAGRRRIPVRLHVYPLAFPERTSLWLGGWSYTDGGGRYGVTAENRQQLVTHLREHFVNAPWATSGVMMGFAFDEQRDAIQLDTERFDDWIGQWPDASAYLVFLSVGKRFAGTEMGTDAFNRRVAIWIRAWADHLVARGIRPDQVGLLLVDEPHQHEQDDVIIAWARAIKAADTGVLIWEDPAYRNPADGRPEMYAISDILCPNRPMWLSAGPGFERFYMDQRKAGRVLQLYSCSGPARLLDPHSYYRLQAWHCWRIGATGSFFWAFGDNGRSSSWNEYAAVHHPYTPLFLDDSAVTAAKQMEAVRESVEDFEYLTMLERAVRKAEAAGVSGEHLDQARKLLETAADDVLSNDGPGQLTWHEPKDRGTADRTRVQILRALSGLASGR